MSDDNPPRQRAFRVADANHLEKVFRAMARTLHPPGEGPVALVGLRRRGVPCAERLSLLLGASGLAAPAGELGLKRYDDDLNILHQDPQLEELPLPFPVDGVRIVVVDDVLYTGRTLLVAVNHLLSIGARSVDCAVLCSRDRPEVPVDATAAGMRLDVPSGFAIEVHAPPFQDDFGVWIRQVQP